MWLIGFRCLGRYIGLIFKGWSVQEELTFRHFKMRPQRLLETFWPIYPVMQRRIPKEGRLFPSLSSFLFDLLFFVLFSRVFLSLLLFIFLCLTCVSSACLDTDASPVDPVTPWIPARRIWCELELYSTWRIQNSVSQTASSLQLIICHKVLPVGSVNGKKPPF